MASLRRFAFAMAGLVSQRTPSTAVRRISSTSTVGRRTSSGSEFGPRLQSGGGGGARRGHKRRGGGRGRSAGLLPIAFVGGVAVYWYMSSSSSTTKDDQAKSMASSPPRRNVIIPQAEIEFEDTAATAVAATPQQRQVASSRAQPGVYAWGSNAGGVVAPDLPLDGRGSTATIKEPRRIPFFDGKALRDLRLDRDVGVAVTDKGDVLQWGVGFWGPDAAAATTAQKEKRSGNSGLEPVVTLTGKDIVKVALSKDRVLALAANGTVYSLPVAQKDMLAAQQKTKTDPAAAATTSPLPWWRRALWSSAPTATTGSLGLRTLTPAGLAWGERVVDVSSGLEHCLLLTSKGRVYSAVSSFESFPARGQLGVPGLSWASWQQQQQQQQQQKAIDQPHEVLDLHGIAAAQIATGDYHSLVRARNGTLYAFGDNSTGQLGIAASPAFPWTDTPVQVPVEALYENGSKDPKVAGAVVRRPSSRRPTPPQVTSIAAGGATSFFTVAVPTAAGAGADATMVDTWSCGSGIYGSLGTGKWVHISTKGPGRITALSGLREYSEATGKMVPIRLAQLAAGATHACAVLANATHVAGQPTTSGALSSVPSWGADVFFWGGNEYGQLGTGRRNNQSEPIHIAPLDRVPGQTDAAAAAAPGSALLDQTRERLALTPRTTVQLATGRTVSAEQRVVCGRYVTAVYSAV